MEDDKLSHIQPPSEAIGFKVVVCPGNQRQACWDFIVLIHPDDRNEAQQFAKQICEQILADGDLYSIYSLSYADVGDDEDQDVPVFSFDGKNPENFEWLKPPRHLTH